MKAGDANPSYLEHPYYNIAKKIPHGILHCLNPLLVDRVSLALLG